jgi:hypothetical protein
MLPGYVILLETSYERICLLSTLDDSIFLSPNIYPSVKYFLRPGDEDLCKHELLKLFQYVQVNFSFFSFVFFFLNFN